MQSSRGPSQMSLDSLLDLFSYQTLSNLPDHIVRSLLVPSQRFSLYHSTSDDIRILAETRRIPSDPLMLRRIYGVALDPADAIHAIDEGAISFPPSVQSALLENYSPASIGTTSLRKGPSINKQDSMEQQTSGQDQGEASIAEMHNLSRNIAALSIPPLGTDFGCLIQPSDGRPFRYVQRSSVPSRSHPVVVLLRRHLTHQHLLIVKVISPGDPKKTV